MKEQEIHILKIEKRIYEIRGKRIILDFDLAELYGAETRALVQAVKRNRRRFPEDFIFSLSLQEVAILKSQSVISRSWGGRRRSLPYAFTEHGAVMAATVLNSSVAIDTSIMIVRAFMHLREMVFDNAQLKRRLVSLEQQISKRFSEHAEELAEIRLLIYNLEQPVEVKKQSIGFHAAKKKQG